MTSQSITHLHAPNRGGVKDYVDVFIGRDAVSGKIGIRKQTAATTHLPENCVLHYSGYGFANRGVPLWLLNKIQTERTHTKMLGVFFHELYAVGPPWGSAFWLSPFQRYIASSLAKTSDFWITNREGSAAWLRRFAGDKPHAVLPVFSNVGEMQAYSSQRSPKVVVFGSAGVRISTYRAAGQALFSWARKQGLVLHDIGPVIDDPVLSALLQGPGVVQHGRIEATEVSKQLSDAMFGVVAYPVDYVAKSGVFAAYSAHGVCPILISKCYAPADGLKAGTHYIDGLPLGDIRQSTFSRDIGNAAWNWYQPHGIMAHVKTLKQLLNEASSAC